LNATDPGPLSERGRGLILVHIIASKYGVEDRLFDDEEGSYVASKTVWFELHG
jgi:hypothetical protein